MEILKTTEPKLALRSTADTFSGDEQELIRRAENDSDDDNAWGRWRAWGPCGEGGIEGNADSKTKLAQLLRDFDSSFDALFAFLSEQYQIEPPTSSSTTRISLPFQSALQTSSRSPSTSPANALRPTSSPTIPSVLPISPLTSASDSVPSTTPAYTFDPLRKDLNVVYYAQSPATPQISLPQLCADPSIDIIILAFVSYFFVNPTLQPSRFPTLNLASKCWAPNEAQRAAGADTLIDCVSPGFAAEVAACQASGKKVLLSLGGAAGYSNTDITSEEKARELASTLWDLFLGGENPAVAGIRPFGNVVLDGIDIDNENPSGATYLPALASSLRTLFSSAAANNPSKTYYLSAAPQCPGPDANIPIIFMLNTLDFIMPQFYNNPACNLNSDTAFLNSLQAWSNDISAPTTFMNIGNGITSPRLLIGSPASQAAGSGYVDPNTYGTILENVKSLGLGNLAGSMFWDGAYVELSKQGNEGRGFAEVVREVLG